MTFKVKDGLALGATTIIDASGNLTMPATGKLSLATATSSLSSINIGAGAVDPTTPATGDAWFNNGAFKLRISGSTKTIAFLDSNITGTANGTSSIIPVSLGGTNSSAAATAGGIAYGNGTAILVTAAGSSGNVLTSGAGGAPTWTAAVSTNTIDTIVKRDGSGAFAAGAITATSVSSTVGLTLSSATTNALSIDSGTTGAINVGVNANAKTITIGNLTGATSVILNTGTGLLNVKASTAQTNTVANVLTITHTSGIPAIGTGTGIAFVTETATGENLETGSLIQSIATDITGATEDFDLVFLNMAAGAAATEGFRIKSTGSVSIPTGGNYQINGTSVLNGSTLGSGVTASSLTSVGTIGTGVWQGSVINSTYGGTGVNNGGRTLTIATSSGTIAFTTAVTLTVAATASVSGTNTGDQTTISGLAGSATNIAGGVANQIPYQTGAGATSFFSAANYGVATYGATGIPAAVAGAAGVLQGSASAIPAFTTAPTLTGTNITSIPTESINGGNLGSTVLPYSTASATASAFKVPFVNTTGVASGNFGLLIDSVGSEFTYNPSTNTLVAGTFSGALSGNASTVTTNANLTGPITSSGNATAVASQTGSGSTFVMNTSPTITGTIAVNEMTVAGASIPQNSKSAAYTLVASDANKHIFHPAADTTARTWTIPANASVPFSIGTAITFVNQNAAGVITIAITTDVMRLAGTGTTGSRTLADNGVATALKVTATQWIISGTGLT